MKQIRHILQALALLALLSTINHPLSTAQAAATWYVWQNSSVNGPGTTWNTAFQDIQSAVNAAAVGDTVLVTNGVYIMVGSGSNSWGGYVVSVPNAITVSSVNGPAATTISGYSGGMYHICVSLGANAVLSGFTVANGGAQMGAAVGVVCGDGAVVTNCSITACWGNGHGGGAYGGTLYNCTLTGNYGGYGGGGGAWNSVLYNCVLSGNQGCYTGGGAAYCTLYNCVLTGNSLGAICGAYQTAGGGAYACTLNNCLIVNNSAAVGGGAFNSTLNNCTVVSNTASFWGGGVAGAYPPQWGGGIQPSFLTNCIVYGNSAPTYPDYEPNSALSYCCAASLPPGPGNIAADPLFANPATGDYHLLAASPCIDAGDNDYVVGATDLDGTPRILNGIVDMGAYENLGSLSRPRITNSIASATVTSGSSVTLSVGVSGTPPFTYQWFCNGQPVPDATNATLTITRFGPLNAGSYTVTVGNQVGSVTSQPALLASADLNLFAGVVVNGPIGSNYLIQATSALQTNWVTLTNIALPTQPYVFIDYSSPTNRQQFYRAMPAQ